ncbi:hypothetical protein ACFWFQ_00790 [Nocardia salmonicida]|uniref:hypothetical protein n=1 Tax=Nocardia salmonicida TaxID=53431 RepID=UPI00365A0702
MAEPWDEYLEALRVMQDAPKVAGDRRRTINDTKNQRVQNADQLAQSAVGKRDRLDNRLRELAALARAADAKVTTLATDAPSVITLPDPQTVADVVQTADLLTEHIQHATKCLGEARRRKARRQVVVPQPVVPVTPPPPPFPVPVPQRPDIPWPLVVAGIIASLLILTVIIAILL